jgi:hypothetical protein
MLLACGFGSNKAIAATKTAGAGNWTVVHSPNRTNQAIKDVTCVSPADCWGVGWYTAQTDDEVGQTLIEHWNGSEWSIVPSPNATAAAGNYLVHIACLSASNCWAVGYVYSPDYSALIEHWDGTTWSLVSSPHVDLHYYFVKSIACNSASDCWLVGESEDPDTYAIEPLFEHWNGTAWSIINSAPSGFYEDIACNGASDCWAVGDSFAHWNGNAWTVVTAGAGTHLSALTCLATDQCWAVGWRSPDFGPDENLFEKWDGTSWSAAPSPIGSLEDITCISANGCWGVGYSYDDDGITSPQLEYWNGTDWSNVGPPPLENASGLLAVACTSSSNCWATGFERASHTLVEHWDGNAWSRTSSGDAIGGGLNTNLNDIACGSLNDCWAVGNVFVHWDGTSWSLFGETKESLYAVNCTSAIDCWAVGEHRVESGVSHTFIQHWNGSSWSVVPSPNADDTHRNYLGDVVCTSTSDCWAVGTVSDEDGVVPPRPLVEHWNGAAWSIVPTPPPPQAYRYHLLDGVTCVSSSDCWMVGYYRPANSSQSQTLTEHWDGSSWTIVSSPNQDPDYNYLTSVTCASGSDCWAVGTHFQHWDGLAWSIISHPGGFIDISCRSSSDCRALADNTIEHWDGSAWTPEELEYSFYPQSFDYHDLHALACPSETHCWAVGNAEIKNAYNGYDSRTLIYKFTPKPSLTSAVSRQQHGAQAFDVNLALTGKPTVECRSGGPGGNYQLVMTFANSLTSVDAVGASAYTTDPHWPEFLVANAAIGADPHQIIVNLDGVPNGNYVQLYLRHVQDSAGNVGNFLQPIDVLLGDTTGDGVVNSADIAQTKSQSGQSITNSNFREDLTADGNINSADIGFVKSKSGTALP